MSMHPAYLLFASVLLAQEDVARPVPWLQALDTALAHFDEYGTMTGFKRPRIAPASAKSLDWLLGSTAEGTVRNPFPPGHPSFREAAALLATLKQSEKLPAAVSLREPGSQLAYWKWGAGLSRRNGWPAPTRRAWEDQLLAPSIQPLIREYALRHALCFALAEADEARFTSLKAAHGGEAADLFKPFQAALALLGAPAPPLRLWSLPDLAPVDVPLSGGNLRRLWVCQAPEGLLPALPADTLWVIPTREGQAPNDVDTLDEGTRREANALAARLPPGNPPFLAASRGALERVGLVFFPALVDLEATGRVSRILMGDAALAAGLSQDKGPFIR
jgi:hypothetical protein